MNIRLKVIALIGAIFAILVWAEVLVERHVVMPSFAELERADARTAMRRVNYALERTLHEVAMLAADWGNWAEAYRFAGDRNPEFVATNISNFALRQLNANVLLIVDQDGRFLHASDLDLQTDRPLRLRADFRQRAAAGLPLAAVSGNHDTGARIAAHQERDSHARGRAGARR